MKNEGLELIGRRPLAIREVAQMVMCLAVPALAVAASYWGMMALYVALEGG